MGLRTFLKTARVFYDKIKPEILMMTTTFPSMTTAATTSILTGVFPDEHGVVADRFFNIETGERWDVRPNLSDNTRLRLPRVVPVISNVLLSDLFDEKDCEVGFITAGGSHSAAERRRFMDQFFQAEFEVAGVYKKTNDNLGTFRESIEFIKRNKGKRFWLLFVRFSIDRFAHHYGADDERVLSEARNVFEYIVSLNEALKASDGKKTLSFLTADHGHKPVPEGFVEFAKFKKYLEPGYRFYATNQTLLSLYYEELHDMSLKSVSMPRLARVKKKGSDFLANDFDAKTWVPLRPRSLAAHATYVLDDEKYGTGYLIGDVVIHLENFYVGGGPPSSYSSKFAEFASSHGGLSSSEIDVPGFAWGTN